MSKLMIEVKESEYLIKLQKGNFNLEQLRAVLSHALNLSDWDVSTENLGFTVMRNADLVDRFDHLSDK